MSLEISGTVTGDVAGGNIIHCYPGVDCSTLRTGLIIATLGVLCWWWLKPRPPVPELPPVP